MFFKHEYITQPMLVLENAIIKTYQDLTSAIWAKGDIIGQADADALKWMEQVMTGNTDETATKWVQFEKEKPQSWLTIKIQGCQW